MSREIKFRAWWYANVWEDDHTPRMLHNVQNFYDTMGAVENGNAYEPEASFGGVLETPESYHVMQYTGAKDKTGEEVYEGDIAKWCNKPDLWRVVWNQEVCAFELESMQDSRISVGLFGRAPELLEVVGNVYENPELLANS